MAFLKREQINAKASWLGQSWIRPYIYSRPANAIKVPGSLYELDWFQQSILQFNAFRMSDVHFADQILKLEGMAFTASNMITPRWVFYDCGLMPGLVTGFAIQRNRLSEDALRILTPSPDLEWVPLSLYIMIPSVAKEEWVAHNLSSSNALLGINDRYYALGFLSKAFGLWYANVKFLCGMTQWLSPAIKLHSHYGDFEVLTAYTPVHTHSETLTYRCRIHPSYWASFFQPTNLDDVSKKFVKSPLVLNPKDAESLKFLQTHLEAGQGPYYLNPKEIRTLPLGSPLQVFRNRSASEDKPLPS